MKVMAGGACPPRPGTRPPGSVRGPGGGGAGSCAAPVVEDGAVGVGLPAPAEQRQHGPADRCPAGRRRSRWCEGHRPVGLHDHPGRCRAHRGEPRRALEVGGGADRGRQADEGHPGRGEHQHLLPHRAPVGILEVVDLVEDDHGQIVEQRRPGEDHVAEDLGGHHHHRGLGLMGHVSGEQTHPVLAVAQGQLGELLIGQGLDRRGVERLAPVRSPPGRQRPRPIRVLPDPVGADTSTDSPRSMASIDRRWNSSRANDRPPSKCSRNPSPTSSPASWAVPRMPPGVIARGASR